jgi:hypothetical protein
VKRAPFLSIVLSGGVASLALAYPTEAAAGDQSSPGPSVSAGGISVNAGSASVNAGNTSVSAGHGGASVSAGGGSVSAGQGGASVSAGNTSVGASQGGASVTAGGTSVSDAGNSGSTNTGSGGQTTVTGRPVGDRSYGSLGEWFADLRANWSGGKSKVSGKMKTRTTHLSSTQTRQTLKFGRTQVNRVVQENSATVTADGGSATFKTEQKATLRTEQKNVNVTEQKN